MASKTSRVLTVSRSRIHSAAGTISVLAVLSATLSGCERGVLDPAGPVSAGERVILLDSLAIMLAIVVPTILCTLGFCLVVSRHESARSSTRRSGRTPVASSFWSGPFRRSSSCFSAASPGSAPMTSIPPKPLSAQREPLEVQVVALDWKWLFIYPEQHIASINRLVAPVGTPVHFRLTSASVMNVFFVPQLGSEIYAMNGMVDRTQSTGRSRRHIPRAGRPDQRRWFFGYDLRHARSLPAASFPSGSVPRKRTGRRSMRRHTACCCGSPRTSNPIRIGLSPRDLFEAIASRHLPPGEGPRITQPGARPRSTKGGMTCSAN